MAFGSPGPATGEVVFNTALTGYQEIVTDPSYRGQLVCMTAPHIGVVGCNPGDEEADGPQAQALIVRSLSTTASNWRSSGSLPDYLASHGTAGIAEIDTRALTILLRSKGAVNGCVMAGDDTARALQLARECPDMTGQPLGASAGVASKTDWPTGPWQDATDTFAAPANAGPAVAVLDCGAKRAIMRELAGCGLRVEVVPYQSSADDIAAGYAGLVLSNGPGDPEPLDGAIELAAALLDRELPLLGICLGHQVLAQAAGGATVKMKFGHHGANHPVLDKRSGVVLITSQNHGFAVDPDRLPAGFAVTHVSLFDGSIQGLAHKTKPVMSYQGHPEASPGPKEMTPIFREFAKLVDSHAKAR